MNLRIVRQNMRKKPAMAARMEARGIRVSGPK
jgi:hypothetical protein